MGIIWRTLINAVAIFVAVYFLKDGLSCCDRAYGFGDLDPYIGYVVAGLILGLLNAFVRPILEMIALPITCLTLGLFHFVISALMLYILSLLPIGFHIKDAAYPGFVYAFVGAVV